jgi:hypothetical protein
LFLLGIEVDEDDSLAETMSVVSHQGKQNAPSGTNLEAVHEPEVLWQDAKHEARDP